MTIEFRCENCGNMISVDGQAGDEVACSSCQKRTTIPTALASLPRPHVPTETPPAVNPAPPSPAPPPVAQTPAVEEVVVGESDAMLGMMARFMPIVISLFFHLGVALVCMFVTMVAVSKSTKAEVVVPDAEISDAHNETLAQRAMSSGPKSTARIVSPREASVAVGVSKMASGGLIAREAPAGAGDFVLDEGMGGGGGHGGTGGALFGGGGSGRGGVSLFGSGSSGGYISHVVYVIDHSGSMLDTFDAIKTELEDSIGRLKDTQDFHVVLFADGPVLENEPRRLIPATQENKIAVVKFLSKIQAESTTGKTDPVLALNRAYDVLEKAGPRQGKLIFLLTDGVFDNNDQVAATVASRNKDKTFHLNTLLYGSQPDVAKNFMEKISKDNGGTYRYVSEAE